MTSAKTMAEVLAEHQQKVGIRDMRSHCWCGWAGEKTGRAFIEHLAAALSAAGYGLVKAVQAKALREAREIVRNQRPEVGPHINVSAYRMGKNDALTIAAANLEARAAAIEADR